MSFLFWMYEEDNTRSASFHKSKKMIHLCMQTHKITSSQQFRKTYVSSFRQIIIRRIKDKKRMLLRKRVNSSTRLSLSPMFNYTVEATEIEQTSCQGTPGN